MYYIKVIAAEDKTCIHYVGGSVDCPIVMLTHRKEERVRFETKEEALKRAETVNKIMYKNKGMTWLIKVVKERERK